MTVLPGQTASLYSGPVDSAEEMTPRERNQFMIARIRSADTPDPYREDGYVLRVVSVPGSGRDSATCARPTGAGTGCATFSRPAGAQ
jgi:hypothetical protein